MTAQGVDPNNPAREALWLLEQLALRYGVAMVRDIIDVLDGKSTDQLIDVVTNLVADAARGILRVLEADAVRAALAAGFAAANAAGDAAIAAKFGG